MADAVPFGVDELSPSLAASAALPSSFDYDVTSRRGKQSESRDFINTGL
jgi:hypothetical protein